MKCKPYILKYREHREWDIFAPDAEDKKPVISISCNRTVAQKIVDSLSHGEGIPVDLVWTIIPTKKKINS